METESYGSTRTTRAGDVAITINQPDGQDKSLLVLQQSYFGLKLKRRRTEDATDICEVEKNGNIVGVTACKFSSEFGNNCCFRPEQRAARHFHYTIVEPFGDEILTVKGYQYPICCGSKAFAEFTKYRKLIGQISYNGDDNVYRVCDSNNQLLFTIDGVSSCSLNYFPCGLLCEPTKFRVSLPDGTKIGEIGNAWDRSIPFISNGQFGVSFPESIDAEMQWVLLGSSLLLKWQFWRSCNNGVWCLLYVLIVIALIVSACVGLSILL